MRPLCDETCFRSARPICASFSDGPGFRHSDSSSCISISPCGIKTASSASTAMWGAKQAYLDIQVLVDLDCVAEYRNVLCEVGKLPHAAQSLQCARRLRGVLDVHLARGALAGGHRGGACRGRRVPRASAERNWVWPQPRGVQAVSKMCALSRKKARGRSGCGA